MYRLLLFMCQLGANKAQRALHKPPHLKKGLVSHNSTLSYLGEWLIAPRIITCADASHKVASFALYKGKHMHRGGQAVLKHQQLSYCAGTT